MLAKCANPPCSSAFHYLEEGLLFRRESEFAEISQTEYFWLCSTCCTKMTLRLNGEGAVTAIPLERRLGRPASGVHFIPLDRKRGALLSYLAAELSSLHKGW
jgi:hypothetical protein